MSRPRARGTPWPGARSQVMEVLTPDVTAWTDGGGKIRAALRPLHGADSVAAGYLASWPASHPDVGIHHVLVNGEPATRTSYITSRHAEPAISRLARGVAEELAAWRQSLQPLGQASLPGSRRSR
jgi:hypothetical protein